MTYAELEEEILKRVGSEYESVISARVAEHVIKAMCDLIRARQYDRNDIIELIVVEEITLPTPAQIKIFTASNDLTGDPDVLEIRDIMEDPDATSYKGIRFIKKDKPEIANALNNEYLQPDTTTVYWYVSGDYVKFYKSTIAATTEILFEYVVTPAGEWSGEMVGKYSLTFLNKVMDMATETLLIENNRQ